MYIFQLETKEWVARRSAPVAIFRYGNQPPFLYKHGLIKHTDAHAHALTSTTKQHKQTKKPFLIKSHQPKHSLYSPLAIITLHTHSHSLFFSPPQSLWLTCAVVLEALCQAYCGWLSSSAQIASASYRRRRGGTGKGHRERWYEHGVRLLEFICDMKGSQKQNKKSHKQTDRGNDVKEKMGIKNKSLTTKCLHVTERRCVAL